MPRENRRQKRTQPVNHSEFHILLALADRERHGYGIMQEVADKSGETVKLGPGTLYGAIDRMLNSGLIEESSKRPAAKKDDSRRSCYYRITPAGREVARRETQRLASLVELAASKHLVSPIDLNIAPN